MTSLYIARPRTTQPPPRRARRRRAAKNAKKPDEDATPPSTTTTTTATKPLSELGDSLLKQIDCLSTVEADDSIEVQFLDDNDKPHMMPSFCSKLHPSPSLDRSLINASTDDTAANTSSEDSLLYSPQTNGNFASCLNEEFNAISSAMGKSSAPGEFSDVGLGETDDEYVSLADLNTRPGWMPRAVTDVWNNVISSNWQCWQGTAHQSPSSGPMSKCGKSSDRFGSKNNKQLKKKVKMKKDSSFTVNPLEGKSKKLSVIKKMKKGSAKKLLADETTTKESLKSQNSFVDEPLFGRTLFGTQGSEDRNPPSEDKDGGSQYSEFPHISVLPVINDSFTSKDSIDDEKSKTPIMGSTKKMLWPRG